MEFLSQYERKSGQLINKSKSCFIVGSKVDIQISKSIAASTGFQKKNLPVKYFGCSTFAGRKKIEYFNDISAKFEKKMAGWKAKFLSQGGKMVLIKQFYKASSL